MKKYLFLVLLLAQSCTLHEAKIDYSYTLGNDSLVVYIEDPRFFIPTITWTIRDAYSPADFIEEAKPYFIIKDSSVMAAVNSSIRAAVFDTLRTTYSPRLKTLTPSHPLYEFLSEPFYENAINCWFAALYYHDSIIDTIGFGAVNSEPIQINNLVFRDSTLHNLIFSLGLIAIDSVSHSTPNNKMIVIP